MSGQLEIFEEELAKIIEISRFFGKDPDMVQGGGGNTSVKIDGRMMYVKASGTTLRMADRESFLLVNKDDVLKILNDKSISSLNAKERDEAVSKRMKTLAEKETNKRPSIETFLHALLGKYVVHIHPVYVNVLVCIEGGEALAREIFKGILDYVWVSFERPGYPLGYELKKGIEKFQLKYASFPKVVFLQNHGIIISSENEREIFFFVDTVISNIRGYFGDLHFQNTGRRSNTESFMSGIEEAYERAGITEKVFRIVDSRLIDAVIVMKDCSEFFVKGSLFPDQVVYCAEFPLFLKESAASAEICNSLIKYIDEFRYPPKVIVIQGIGVVLIGESEVEVSAMEETIIAHLKTLLLIREKGVPLYLPQNDVSYIANWESEKYRRKLMA